MPPFELDPQTLSRLQELIEANFTARDELYAAAESLDDEARKKVCRRLAEHLAGYAAELQQVVTASGVEPAGPLEIESVAHSLFGLAKMNRGSAGVLQTAAEGEHNLKQDYDKAIDATTNPAAKNSLRRQRDEVEFGEQVLRGMAPGSSPEAAGAEKRQAPRSGGNSRQ